MTIYDEWVDPDDAPELTSEWFRAADVKMGDVLVSKGKAPRRGRPLYGSEPKIQQSLRLDREVLDKFKATGPGWQARINQVLKEAKL